MARVVSRLTLGVQAGAIPEANSIRSIPEVTYRPAIMQHIRQITEISPARVEHYAFPEHYPPEFRRDKAYDARYLYDLRDVVVGPESGLCWLPDGPILQESVGSLMRILGWGNCLHEMLRRPVRGNVSGPLVPFPPTPYFHWLLEVLPCALRAVEKRPDAVLLVHPGSPPYVRDGMRLFFGGAVTTLVSERPVAVRSARIASMHESAGFVPSVDVSLLRSRAALVLNEGGANNGKLVYVSRRLARSRTEPMAQGVDRVLHNLGFEVVTAEALGLAEQIVLFSSARAIVGIHGAGLANMVWAPPGCRVLELFPEGTFNDCFARLAFTCGHDYQFESLEPSASRSAQLLRLLATG